MEWLLILVALIVATGIGVGAGRFVLRQKKAAWQLPPSPPRPAWADRTNLEPGRDYCFLRADFRWRDQPSPGNAYIYVHYFGETKQPNEQLANNGAPGIFFKKEKELLRDGWEKVYWNSNDEGATLYFTRPHR